MFLTASTSEASVNVAKSLPQWIGDISSAIVLIYLSLETIRWVLRISGYINPDSKFGRIVYGDYDRRLLTSALKDLGFSRAQQDYIIKGAQKNATEVISNDITKENAAIQLIILLAKYIVKLPTNSIYGINTPSKSEYYIDTMEASHNKDDLKKMVSLIKILIAECGYSPSVIITPKGGNVILAKRIANLYSAAYLMAKDQSDSSKLTAEDKRIEFMVNYEGSFGIVDSGCRNTCVLVDCNTSGGGQLLNIIKDLADRKSSSECKIEVPSPQNAFILFRVDDSKEYLDQEFINNNCPLIRYLDLNEDTKRQLYELKTNSVEPNQPDFYYKNDREHAEKILDNLKQTGKLFFNNGELSNGSAVGSR